MNGGGIGTAMQPAVRVEGPSFPPHGGEGVSLGTQPWELAEPCLPQPPLPRGKGSKRRSSSPELLRCKRRLAFPGLAGGGGGAAAVARRNERERNRVKLVNLGFQALRQHVPNGAAAKKMSKVETLRSAVEYIRALQRLLEQHDAAGPAASAAAAAFPEGLLANAVAGNGGLLGGCRGTGPFASASAAFEGHGGSSVPGSPRSAYSSDESGYEGALSPEEEQELLDFTCWLGSY